MELLLSVLAAAVAMAGLVYTVWRDRLMDRRVRCVEEQQRQERELEMLRRSKAAPLLKPYDGLASMVHFRDHGEVRCWERGDGNVLMGEREEVAEDLDDGDPVVLVLSSSGNGMRGARVTGDIPGAAFCEEPAIADAEGLVFLRYPFVKALRGKHQKVVLSFETDDGYDLTHVYETRHGFREFQRVDPP